MSQQQLSNEEFDQLKGHYDEVAVRSHSINTRCYTEAKFLDIEREQTPMMQALHQIIRPGGVLYYSTNFRKFTLNDSTFDGYDATEISQNTVPPDFRDRRIHRCWRALRRGG